MILPSKWVNATSYSLQGKIIPKDGIQPDRPKIEAMLKVKPPHDQAQLKYFVLGMVNHYSKFIRCLADFSERCSLRRMPSRLFWQTESPYNYKCFGSGLACDASIEGSGAVIYHKYLDGSKRPIANVSKTLSDSERNSQIECDTLSIFSPHRPKNHS